MIDSNRIAVNVFKYTKYLLEVPCKNDEAVRKSVEQFVKTTQIALSHFFHSIQLPSDNSSVLRSLINPMDSQQSFSFSYGYLPIMKQCTNPLYFLHFTQYYLTLVLSLPEQFHPSWIKQYKTHPSEWVKEENYDKKPLNDLRILFQHTLFPALHPFLIPYSNLQCFLDFDGTLTDRDTCEVGIRGNAIFEEDTLDRQALYKDLLAQYKDGFNNQFNDALSKPTIMEFCEEYDRMDYDCLEPVEKAGLFKGLQKHKVGITGRLIDLSTNVSYFLQHENLNSLYVISQSWYREMLQMCLCNNPFEGNLHILPSHIYSSSLIYDDKGIATGYLNKRCGGCNHKVSVIDQLIQDKAFTVAIGDSLGDLGMFLRVQLPILLHPSDRTLRVLNHYHIDIHPIMQYHRPLPHTVFVASDWSEIISVLCWNTMQSDSLQPQLPQEKTLNCSNQDCALMSLTNDYYNTTGGDLLKSAIVETIEGGATMIQIRDKTEDFDRMIDHANDLKSITKQYNVPLVINDRVDVAILSDVDGVHIGQNDMPAALCRRLLGPHKIMGLSAQTVEQAIKAEQDGADYIGTGAVFPTISKDDADAVGLEGLKKVCSAVKIPVVSIGGVNKENAASTIEAGACGIAVISAIFGREDIREATRELREVVDNALD